MRRNLIVSIAVFVLLPCVVMADKMYKWVDAQGNVSYHDRPPPADAGYRVEEKSVKTRTERAASGGSGDVAEKFPVVLYTISKCASCDAARTHLEKRKIPFTEKNVEKEMKYQDELRAKAGGYSVPTILVGPKVMNGYLESLLDGELDQAGYPKPEAEKKPAEDSGFRAPVQ